MSYLSGRELAALLSAYRATHARHELLADRCAKLAANAAHRRKVRIRRGLARRDKPLLEARKELSVVRCRCSEQRDRIAEAAYLVARNYWPKFAQSLTTDNRQPATDAEDAIQTAVMRVVQVAPLFDAARGSAFNWITKVIQNEFRGLCRKQQQADVNYARFAAATWRAPESGVESEPDQVQIVMPRSQPETARRARLMGASCEFRNHQYVIAYYLGSLAKRLTPPAKRG